MNKIDIVVVSLFDGLSGGRIALERTPHLNVLRYYSSEIDKYAIQIADKNYPQDKKFRLGSVVDIDGNTLLSEIRKEFGDVKILLIGGSPCQGFSMAGKLKGASTKCGQDVVTLEQYIDLKEQGFEFDGQSYLFWEYIRIKQELSPDYFMLENVRITKKWLPMFNEAMGVEPTRINSNLVSAQNRDRYYWHNFGEIPQPEDKGVLLKDILESDVEDKFTCSEAQTNKMIRHGNKITKENIIPKKSACIHAGYFKAGGRDQQYIMLYDIKPSVSKNIIAQESGFQDNKIDIDKCPTLRAGNNCTYVQIPLHKYRKLTPLECERLQTLPDNYTEGVSNTQRYKMIGNGWTIDIITYLFNHIKRSLNENK